MRWYRIDRGLADKHQLGIASGRTRLQGCHGTRGQTGRVANGDGQGCGNKRETVLDCPHSST
jgi:hypothetical protein